MRANFPGAAVSLDGTQVGTTGGNPVVINDVAPGRHEVSVEKSGYTTTKQEFTLAAGQSLPLSLTLSPVSVEVPRPEPSPRGNDSAIPGGGEPPGGENPSMSRVGSKPVSRSVTSTRSSTSTDDFSVQASRPGRRTATSMASPRRR